jgi:toxin ParE1/3/4
MHFEVETHPEAAEELRAAVRWYAERSYQAPSKLIREYDAHVSKIVRSPDGVRFVHGAYRRLNLARFPFAIIYRLRADTIYVIAVMHEKRHPDYWKHRIADDDAA